MKHVVSRAKISNKTIQGEESKTQLILLTPQILNWVWQESEHYNEVFLGHQPGEVVQFFRDQCFEDHLCPRPQGC
jgi:hypothetical protein